MRQSLLPARWLVTALTAFLSAMLATVHAQAAEHPRLFLSRDDFARLTRSNEPRHQQAVQRVIQTATAMLEQDIYVPEGEGNWIFYLYCPRHNALLQRVAPEQFRCPVDGEQFEGGLYEASWRTTLHDKAASAAETLGLAYQFTGDRRFAEKSASILLRYAEYYPSYERHDRWGRRGTAAFMGGKRYAQALDEAVNIIPCAWAYDLIYDTLPDEQRQHIERDFLRAAARELQVPTFQQNNNHQTWINAGIASIGFALNDERLIHESIDGQHGFHYQMGRLVTVDGLWIEGTMAYQGYAMQPLVMHAEMARRAGLNIAHDPHLKSLFDGPINSAFPDGTFPIINDSDPYHLSTLSDLYEWAYAVYGDAQYGAVAALGRRGGKWAWMVGKDELPRADILPQGSRNLTGIGYLFLQRPVAGIPLSVVLDYGPHGGGHGHPDKLNIILWADGKILFVDPGRISYSVPEYLSWCKQTVAHNTVVIDKTSQQPTTGECLWFTSNELFEASCVRSDGAYPGVDLRRAIVLTADYIMDVFLVESENVHTVDWVVHTRGTPRPDGGFVPPEEPPGTDSGYQHLTEVFAKSVETEQRFLWQVDAETFLRLVAPAPLEPEMWFIGYGIGIHLNDRVSFLLRRQETRSTVFVALYEFTRFPEEPAPALEYSTEGRMASVQIRMKNAVHEWQLPLEAVPNASQREPAPVEAVPGLSLSIAAAR